MVCRLGPFVFVNPRALAGVLILEKIRPVNLGRESDVLTN